ncbi:MAG: AAA family ATPase [Candidatus Hodarchaeota archaeon]
MSHLSPFRLYITGGTGTGKTSVAKKLTKIMSLEYLELNTVVLEKGFYLGYDINRDSVIIDDDLITAYLEEVITNKERICLVGSIIPLKNIFDVIIVLRCRADILRQRLLSRNYPEGKIKANIEAEIMNIVYYEAIEFFSDQNVIEVYNDEYSIDVTCDRIVSKVRKHHPSVLE